MAGIIHVDGAAVEATSGQMLLTLQSGGDDFRFHIPPHIALELRQRIMRDGWQVLCVPDADVVALHARKARGKRACS